MSRVFKNKTVRGHKLTIIENANKNEKKIINKINKVWSLETITFIAFIATIVSSYILFALTTWTQVNLIPKRNLGYSQIEAYQQGRMQLFENFRKNWTDMRIGFGYFFLDCAKNKMKSEKLNDYLKKNLELINNVRETTAGGTLEYYFGQSINIIYLSELEWYLAHKSQCPSQETSIINLNENLQYREDMLMKLLLHKSYNPYLTNKFQDNLFFFQS